MIITDTDRERFLTKVLPFFDGCLLWQASFSGGRPGYAYPIFHVGHKKLYAHRFSIMAFRGLTIPPDHDVHHVCGDRTCVAWDHLDIIHKIDHQYHHYSGCRHDSLGRIVHGRA